MSTYKLTVLAAYLNGRDAPNGNLNFPSGATLSTGFRAGDVLSADLEQSKWYRITSCLRGGAPVSLPSPVWAYAGDTYGYMRIDQTDTPAPVQTMTVDVILTMSDGVVYEALNVELTKRV